MKKIIIFKTILLLLLISISVVAENPPSPLFPEDSAGMSAYVQVEGIDETNNVFMLNKVQSFLEKEDSVVTSSSNHTIGTLMTKIKVKDTNSSDIIVGSIPVHVYFDTDGYLVAYFLEDEPSSRMIYWNDYTPGSLPSNVLEKSLMMVIEEINHTHTPVKYYHFQHPTATNFSIIVDTACNREDRFRNYSVTVPGTIHEASYGSYYSSSLVGRKCSLSLIVDNKLILRVGNTSWCDAGSYNYFFYPASTFLPHTPHSVRTEGNLSDSTTDIKLGAGTFLLYEIE